MTSIDAAGGPDGDALGESDALGDVDAVAAVGTPPVCPHATRTAPAIQPSKARFIRDVLGPTVLGPNRY
jgi:hypothetical protein